MLYRRFGRTELDMPVFSCGGMRYQHKWQDLPLDEIPGDNQANLEATIRRSVELGVNHIETARGYGSSERQLGLVLPTFDRDKIIVQTKVAPHADPRKFREGFEESLARLRLDHVDLLGIHGINNHETLWQTVRPGGCADVADELVKEGKVRHVGFSTHAPVDLIREAIATDRFSYVNLHWYYINQLNARAVTDAADHDMGVFIISPSDKGGLLYDPPEKLRELTAPLHPLVFNVLFCLRNPNVHTLSLGASKPSDFDLQLSALQHVDDINTLLPPIEAKLRAAMVDTVGEEAADRFAEGLPGWERAPGYMNMPVILWLRHLSLAYEMHDYARMRYNLLGNGGHWFPGLNASRADSLNLDSALADSPFKNEIPGWLREAHKMLGGEQKQRESAG